MLPILSSPRFPESGGVRSVLQWGRSLSSFFVFTGSGSGIGGGMAVGGPITSGTAGYVLFVDSSGNLGQDIKFQWNATIGTLSLTSVDTNDALFMYSDGSQNRGLHGPRWSVGASDGYSVKAGAGDTSLFAGLCYTFGGYNAAVWGFRDGAHGSGSQAAGKFVDSGAASVTILDGTGSLKASDWTGSQVLVTNSGGYAVTVILLPTSLGGTGLASYTKGDVVYASAANTLSQLGVGSIGQVLTVVAGLPAWSNTVTDGTFSIAFCSGGRSAYATDGSNTAQLCDGTYAVYVGSGWISTLGSSGNTYRWENATTAPGTNIGVGIVNYYGTAATNFLGDPNAWVLVNVGGTNYKIPAYL